MPVRRPVAPAAVAVVVFGPLFGLSQVMSGCSTEAELRKEAASTVEASDASAEHSAAHSTQQSATTGSPAATQSPETAPADLATPDFNQADIDFATMMIPHHEQALTMVELAAERRLSPELKSLTDAIAAAQGPEIEQLRDWLGQWGAPVPEPGMTTGHEAHLTGMLTESQLMALAKTRDSEFEHTWVDLMVKHHQGAIEMAKGELIDGQNADALALAESIISTQRAEIDQMHMLVGHTH